MNRTRTGELKLVEVEAHPARGAGGLGLKFRLARICLLKGTAGMTIIYDYIALAARIFRKLTSKDMGIG